MDCPNCGAYNASNSFRCRRCNQILPGAESPPPEEAPRDEGRTDADEFEASWRPADEPEQQRETGPESEWDSPSRRDEPWATPGGTGDPWQGHGQSGPEPGWSGGGSTGEWGAGTPTGPGMPPPDIPNYLWQSIVVTLCCCWPLGIPAIVFAARVNALVSGGNYTEAQETSNRAKNWTLASFAAGLFIWLAVFCATILGEMGTTV